MFGNGVKISTRFLRRIVVHDYRHGHGNFIPHLLNSFHLSSHYNVLASETGLQNPVLNSHSFQRCGISSFASSSQSNEYKTSQWVGSEEDGMTKDDLIKLIDEIEGTLNAMHEQIEQHKKNAEAATLLKTLQQGLMITEKHLAEILKKFGVEKYDPINEQFDGTRHKALFGVVDPTKPLNSVAVVHKAGYILHDDQVLRLAEVGVTVSADVNEKKESQSDRITLEPSSVVDKISDGLANVYIRNKRLKRRAKREKDQKDQKDQIPFIIIVDEQREKISDIEGSNLTTPNEQETNNNLDSDWHKFDKGDNISNSGSSLDTIIKDDTISNSGFRLDTIIKDEPISNSGSSLDTIIEDDALSNLGSNSDMIKDGFEMISDSMSKVGSVVKNIFWDSD